MSDPLTVSGIVLDAESAEDLASFYQAFLGWPVVHASPGWVKLRSPDGGTALAFQTDEGYRPPVWPGAVGEQRMMAHLDIKVSGLDAEVARAISLGARLADHQPQDDIRVLLDPDGHPFCLWDPDELTG